MAPRATFVLSCPLKSVSPLAGSKLTPAGPLNSTSAPATAVPCSSLTCTTRGSDSTMPVAPSCLPPLDSTSAAPKPVGFRVEDGPGLLQAAVMRMRETAKSVRQHLGRCGNPAPKGAFDFRQLTASLKRCPDTNRNFSANCRAAFETTLLSQR